MVTEKFTINKKSTKKFFYVLIGLLILLYLFWPNNEKNQQEINIGYQNTSFIVDSKYIEPIKDDFSNIKTPHWKKMPLIYRFENLESCSEGSKKIRKAFEIISEETEKLVTFEETKEFNSDIVIYCNENPSGGTLASALPNYSNTNSNEIISGEIFYSRDGWYKGECDKYDFPILEIHEILHLFDFKHSPSLESIMSRYAFETQQQCRKAKIDEEYVSCLKYIYSNGAIGTGCNITGQIINEYKGTYYNEETCSDGWYPVAETSYCCPEPNMKILDGYCTE